MRWGISEEDNDKELPYRYLQPTLDISAYFQNGDDPLTQIRLRRPPVVLVHGLWGDAKAWKELEPQLNDNGLYDIEKVNYSETGQVRSVVYHAPELRATIEDALGKAKKQLFAANKVDIIAHSMGGLLTREYCQQYNAECKGRIRRFITIATPHFGSELADILLVYRDDRSNFQNPFPYVCRKTVAKKAAIYLCHRKRGNPLKEIGDYFGISESGVSLASSRFSQTLKRNRKLRRKLEQVQKELDL